MIQDYKIVAALVLLATMAFYIAFNSGSEETPQTTPASVLSNSELPQVSKEELSSPEMKPDAVRTSNKSDNLPAAATSQALDTPQRPDWNQLPTPRYATDEMVQSFLNASIIPDPTSALTESKPLAVGQNNFLAGQYEGTIAMTQLGVEWIVQLAHEPVAMEPGSTGANAPEPVETDEFIKILDHEKNLIYQGDGKGLQHLRQIENVERGILVNCGDTYLMQLYDFESGQFRISGNFYAKDANGKFDHVGRIRLTKK